MIAWLLRLIPNPYVILALGAALIALVGGSWMAGYNAATRKSDIANVRAELAAAKADLTAATTAKADADKRAGALESQSTKNQEALDAIIAFRAKGGVATSCHLDDATALRLRNIR